jgi:hypothetical protein
MNQEVNKIVEELYSCLPNDRNKFNSIMNNLKEEFLSSPNNQKLTYDQKFPTTSYTSQLLSENIISNNNIQNAKINNLTNPNYLMNNTEVNSSLNPLKGSDFQPINHPSYNIQNKQFEGLNNDETGDFMNINNNGYQSGFFNENMYDNKIKNDIHANCKYYYPNEYNFNMNDNNKMQNNDWKNTQMNSLI